MKNKPPVFVLAAEYKAWVMNQYPTQTEWVNRAVIDSPLIAAAFAAGARAMAQDTLDTLGDYACATAGLEGCSTPSESYDKAHASLHVYYTKVLDNFDEDLGKWCE